ncbi:hypothetical protein KKF32_01575 [Patescibacteria group bacterium]|nr:hypothetical protein [Patescibacteria group bacterium]
MKKPLVVDRELIMYPIDNNVYTVKVTSIPATCCETVEKAREAAGLPEKIPFRITLDRANNQAIVWIKPRDRKKL